MSLVYGEHKENTPSVKNRQKNRKKRKEEEKIGRRRRRKNMTTENRSSSAKNRDRSWRFPQRKSSSPCRAVLFLVNEARA